MNNTQTSEKKQSSSFARYVRLTPEEHSQLLEDEKLTGRSAQELLKAGYFGKGRVTLLMSDQDKNTLVVQINRIGSNLNQIARKMNMGIIYGFEEDITQFRILLSHLMTWITTVHPNASDRKGTS